MSNEFVDVRHPPEKTYMILCPLAKKVKIGKTCDLTHRLEVLRTMNAADIELLAIVPDSEAELHEKFKDLRKQGEWFSVHSELASYLRSIGNVVSACRIETIL